MHAILWVEVEVRRSLASITGDDIVVVCLIYESLHVFLKYSYLYILYTYCEYQIIYNFKNIY